MKKAGDAILENDVPVQSRTDTHDLPSSSAVYSSEDGVETVIDIIELAQFG